MAQPPAALPPARLRLPRPGLATALALLGLLLAAAPIPLSVLARQDVASNAGQAGETRRRGR
jgi:hypothetical protein